MTFGDRRDLFILDPDTILTKAASYFENLQVWRGAFVGMYRDPEWFIHDPDPTFQTIFFIFWFGSSRILPELSRVKKVS